MSFFNTPNGENRTRPHEELVVGVTGRLFLLDEAKKNIAEPARLIDYDIIADRDIPPKTSAQVVELQAMRNNDQADIDSLLHQKNARALVDDAHNRNQGDYSLAA